MIQILKTNKEKQFTWKKPNNEDIIIVTRKEEKEYNKDGTYKTKLITKKTNLTKKINETAKLIKQDLARDQIIQVEQAIENAVLEAKEKAMNELKKENK